MSEKPLAERLQVKNGRKLAVLDLPSGIEGLPGGADVPLAEADVVLAFVADRREFDAALGGGLGGMKPDAILWIAYPKLTSALAGNLNRDIIHREAPSHGLDTVSQIAVDKVWSALRLKRVTAAARPSDH